MRTKKSLMGTAYHEAGHAVANFIFHIPISSISIKATAEYLGVVGTSLPETLHKPRTNLYESMKMRKLIEKVVMGLFAGTISEAKYTGRHNHVGAGADYKETIDFIRNYIESDKEASAYLAWLWERTINWVNIPWHWFSIQVVANRLLNKEEMTPNEMEEIITSAISKKLKMRGKDIDFEELLK